jgi:hypothetical protein
MEKMEKCRLEGGMTHFSSKYRLRRIAICGSWTSREKVRNAVREAQEEVLKQDGLDNSENSARV